MEATDAAEQIRDAVGRERAKHESEERFRARVAVVIAFLAMLLARATYWEAKRDHAQLQDPNFDYAIALFQIAIVLGSVGIVATSRPIVGLSLFLGTAATLLTVNGFFLFVPLPIGQ